MRSSRFSTGLELITAPRNFLTFLLGGAAVGILGTASYNVLQAWLNPLVKATAPTRMLNWLSLNLWTDVLMIIVSIATLMLVGRLLHRLAQRLPTRPPWPDKQRPAPRRGLICLVSNEPTLQQAIDWHQETLEWCWLICSSQSSSLAERTAEKLNSQGVKTECLFVNDVLDPVECHHIVDRIYSQLPAELSESDVILDFTGMTAIASVGAVLACLDDQRPIQYTPGLFNQQLQAVKPYEPMEIVLNWNDVGWQRQT